MVATLRKLAFYPSWSIGCGSLTLGGAIHDRFMNNYRPQLFIRTTDVTVALTFPEGTEGADEKQVLPGDNVMLRGELVHEVALEQGSRFTLREGGKTVGTGICVELE